MLEDIQKLPEDRRKVQVIVDVALVAFGLSTFTDGIVFQGGAGSLALGAVASAAGLASLAWLRHRHRHRLVPAPA